jgi:pilus assembly protein CpaE
MFDEEAAHVQIVGFHKDLDPLTLRQSMRAGVREFLNDPFDEPTVMEALANVKRLLEKHPVQYPAAEQIFTFLPSKAGAGTSTIAANVGAALSRRPNARVLLADFDLSSGMLRFMLKLRNEFSVTDAVAHAMDMDEDLWAPLVTNVEGMDVLHAGQINPNLRLEPKHIRNLVGFMRRYYGVLCFDLSGNLEKYSLELMSESKHILLVCTPETASLHLAREKLAFLRHMDLAHRVSVVLTRLHKKTALSEREVEDLVGVPVIRVFPNDYHAVQQALDGGKLLPPASQLGKAFTDLADALVAQKSSTKADSYKRKFLEFITPTA